MSRQVLAATCLAAAALLVVVLGAPSARPDRRLRHLRHPSAVTIGRTRPSWWPDPIRIGAGLAGVAVIVVIGGWPGLLAGALAAVAADRLLRRIEPRALRDRRLRETADLPLAADLLAAALRAGAPVDRSVLAVAEALA
ncbi:secretion system protein, partial [Micromonospora globispora]